MCGIWALLGKLTSVKDYKYFVSKLIPRGPECQTFESINENIHFGFTRLAINGLTKHGDQPVHTDKSVVICNGEIYNYQSLAESIGLTIPEGYSDCFVLNHLFEKYTIQDVCNMIDGVFAIVYYDKKNDKIIVARDPFGVRPLFIGKTKDGSIVFSSEMKGLIDDHDSIESCVEVKHFPPGTYTIYQGSTGELLETKKYHTIKTENITDINIACEKLKDAVINAVEKRVLVSERPIGALLSGGLDSSLIASIASKILQSHGKKLQTFSIGMFGSSDLLYAKKVATYINSDHHEIVLTPNDFLKAIEKVILNAETYDITTIRATVGNYLVGKYIKENTDVKVVLNGDGSDEIGGGYLYFFRAPTDSEFDSECRRLLDEIHIFDVLRSDRGISSNGLEPRTPFLDKHVVNTWLSADVSFRRPKLSTKDCKDGQVEKFLLRKAFETSELLPDEVLWRRKEAFSDGVSPSDTPWFKIIQNFVETKSLPKKTFVHNPPLSKEAYYYRCIFDSFYGDKHSNVIPFMWLPKWSNDTTDPSAKTLSIY